MRVGQIIAHPARCYDRESRRPSGQGGTVEREPARLYRGSGERSADLITTISQRDGMYVSGGEAHYFGVGADALKLVIQAMSLAGKEEIRSILDLPCGYGRVMRYLRAKFPQASLVACDL